MMRCEDIEAAFASDETFDERALNAHLESCKACRALLELGELGSALPSLRDDEPENVNALFARVEADVSRERGLLAFLRSRPTWLRRGLVLAAALGVPVALLLTKDPEASSAGAVYGAGAVAILAAALLASSLHPLHRPPKPVWVDRLLLGAGLSLPVIVALAASPGPAAAAGGAGPCFVMGLLAGAPLAAFAWLLSRGRTVMSMLLGAAGASLAAFVALSAICANTHPEHLLLGHASVVWAALGALSIGFAARQLRN